MTIPSPEQVPTTVHVQRAVEGDHTSVAWVVQRFTPLLYAQARYRIGRGLDGLHDADDMVQEVWVRALPAMARFQPKGDRFTPAFVGWLSKVLLNPYSGLLAKKLRRTAGGHAADEPSELPEETRGVVTRSIQRERASAVSRALDELSDHDREVLVLRGIEQVPNQVVAQQLGLEASAASKRYERALQRLREQLPGSVLAELETVD